MYKPKEVFNHRLPSSIMTFLSLSVFIIVVLGPIVLLSGMLVYYAAWGSTEILDVFFLKSRKLMLLLKSMAFALGVSTGDMVLGTLIASLLWQIRTKPMVYLRWMFIILAPVPQYIHALAWYSLLNRVNTMLQFIGLNTLEVQGWIISWFVQMMAYLPLAAALGLLGLELVDHGLMEASRIFYTDIKCLLRVALPLAAPVILAGGGILFVLCLTDFTIPSLFGVNPYSLEIFAEFSLTNDPVMAYKASLPLLLVTVLVIAFSLTRLKRVFVKNNEMAKEWPVPLVFPGWFRLIQSISVLLLFCQFMVPILVLTLDINMWKNLIFSLTSAREEILATFVILILAVIVSIPVSLGTAWYGEKSQKIQKILWLIMIFPLAIPAPLTGIGLVAIFNRPMPIDIYQTVLMPVFASMGRFLPIAAMVLLSCILRFDRALIESAQILEKKSYLIWWKIILPIMLPGIMVSSALVFIFSAGELGATLIVTPPGMSTLTIRIYNYLHYGASDTVSGLCLIILLLCLLPGVIITAIIMKRSFHGKALEITEKTIH